MNTLTNLINDANTLIADNSDLLALYDPDATPLRQYLSVDQENSLRNSERRSLSGIERLIEGLAKAKTTIENPDIHDGVKADVLAKLAHLVTGDG